MMLLCWCLVLGVHSHGTMGWFPLFVVAGGHFTFVHYDGWVFTFLGPPSGRYILWRYSAYLHLPSFRHYMLLSDVVDIPICYCPIHYCDYCPFLLFSIHSQYSVFHCQYSLYLFIVHIWLCCDSFYIHWLDDYIIFVDCWWWWHLIFICYMIFLIYSWYSGVTVGIVTLSWYHVVLTLLWLLFCSVLLWSDYSIIVAIQPVLKQSLIPSTLFQYCDIIGIIVNLFIIQLTVLL